MKQLLWGWVVYRVGTDNFPALVLGVHPAKSDTEYPRLDINVFYPGEMTFLHGVPFGHESGQWSWQEDWLGEDDAWDDDEVIPEASP